MNCAEVQDALSLYLYGELDFAREEHLESHLDECELCQRSFAREKQWHTVLTGETIDPPLDLLAKCRQDLRLPLTQAASGVPESGRFANLLMRLRRQIASLGISFPRWSPQVAMASLLVGVGFISARWMDSNQRPSGLSELQASLFTPATHIRDIQADTGGEVRIVVDQERQVSGRVDDEDVRRLLLAATRNNDPGLRVYSLEILNGRGGQDVRDVLYYSGAHDPNAAVRLKAIEALRHFRNDPATVPMLRSVLEHDDNLSVRAEAINVLLPADQDLLLTPELASTLESVMRASQEDEYVRAICEQWLRNANFPDVY